MHGAEAFHTPISALEAFMDTDGSSPISLLSVTGVKDVPMEQAALRILSVQYV